MAGEGRLDIAGIPGPVTALVLLVEQAGVAKNLWWDGGTSFVADGSLTVASGNTLACYQESLSASWLADLPAGLPTLGKYRFYFFAGTPSLSAQPWGWADFGSGYLAPAQPVGAGGTHYFIDWTGQGFWPVLLPAGIQPTAMVRYAANSSQISQVILGGLDGYLRNYSASADTDDGSLLASLVTYGPFRLGGPGYYGQILQIAADLDSNGQGVAWGIYAGHNAQDAVAAAEAGKTPWSGAWQAGLNHRYYPKAVGAGLAIVLSGAGMWAVEGIRLEGKKRGPLR